jgi:RNA polymerase sigma factor (sigma-70 family)
LIEEFSLPSKKRKSADLDVSLEEAFERYYPAIFRYFRFRGSDIQTANDLAASTFERALENLSRFDPAKAQIQTWLFTIAHNLSINHWKTETHHQTIPLEELETTAPFDPLPEDVIVRSQDRKEILEAFQTLDPRAMDILALKFGGCLTNRQIGELLRLSSTNVGIILYRSLIKLHQILALKQPEALDEHR